MIKLSKRMQKVADMVTPGKRVADIGCDHAFISIYLAEHGIASAVYALDVAEGPLAIAKRNIAESGMENNIITRLSDGFEAVEEGVTDAAIISGMGGMLMVDIICRGLEKLKSGYELYLSPQSDLYEVRKFLREHSFEIIDEDMLIEEGKYYNVIKARRGLYFDENLSNSFYTK